jgi:gamma-glutamylcyclotransferase (GGCT)/AIG2-like uncharacterized protein YtfP
MKLGWNDTIDKWRMYRSRAPVPFYDADPSRSLLETVPRRTPVMECGNYLFVYGSLRSGVKNPARHLLEKHAILVDTGAFQGKLYDLGRYPGAVPSRGTRDRVIGEIYHLTDPRVTLEILDECEGRHFKRKRVTIEKQHGQRVTAWIYLYVGTVKQQSRIHSGDYLRYRNSGLG